MRELVFATGVGEISTPDLRERVVEIGPLRVALLGAVVVLVASAPFASFGPEGFEAIHASQALGVGGSALGPREIGVSMGLVWTTLVAPPLAVMMAFVVPLDMLMSRIYMTDKPDAERARYRRILAAESLAFVLLVAAWTPFFVALLSL